MKKMNGKIKWALSIAICVLFIATAFSGASNKMVEELIVSTADDGASALIEFKSTVSNNLEMAIDPSDYTVSDNLDVAIDASNPSEISCMNEVFHIYEGLHWRLYVTVRWDPPQPDRLICLWVDASTLPAGAIFDACHCSEGEVTSTLDWTPSIGQAGTYQIVFYAGESCYEPIGSFTITVIVHPYEPEPQDTFEIYECQEWHLRVTAYWVPPQEKLICLWVDTTTLPEGATFTPCHCDYGEVTSDLYWHPAIGQAGEYIIIFLAGEYCGYYVFPFSICVIVYPAEEDTIPPTTTKTIGEPQYDDGYYVTSKTPFTLTAVDNNGGSGVNYTNYRVWHEDTWSDWKTYEESFTLEHEGLLYLEFYSADIAENIEEVQNQPHYVDDTPPTIYFTKDGDNHVTDRWALIFVSDDQPLPGGDAMYGIAFPSQGLFAYSVLKAHGYPDDRIFFTLWHKNFAQISIEENKDTDYLPKATIDRDHTSIGIGPNQKRSMKELLKGEIEALAQAIKNKGEETSAEVLIYLVDHGYKIEVMPPKTPPEYEYYFGSGDGGNPPNWNKIVRSDELGQWLDKIKCKKMVILLDFCYSGGFISHLDKPKRIIITASDEDKTANFYYWKRLNPPKALGGRSEFFGPFWEAINGSKKIKDAFNDAKKVKSKTDSTKTVAQRQNPQKKDNVGNWDKNSPVDTENIKKNTKCKLTPKISEHMTFAPVDGDSIYYRIRYENSWSNWRTYVTPFILGDEGKGEGTYYLEWYGVDPLGNEENITQVTLLVDETPPSVPTLVFPENGASSYVTSTFKWNEVNDPSDVYYSLQVSKDSMFSTIVLEKTMLCQPKYAVLKGEALSPSVYYWRVRAIDGLHQAGNWSDIWSFTAAGDNQPPEKPGIPSGPSRGGVGDEYSYSSSTTDVDGDEIRFLFDWGDGTQDYTTWYKSGETGVALHYWEEKGTYKIKIQAEDEHGYESEWSDPLSISMPKNKNINIETPKHGYLYLFGREVIPLRKTVIIGPVTIGINDNDADDIDKVEFYIDDELRHTDYNWPYKWMWDETVFFGHTLKAVAYDNAGNYASDEIKMCIFNI